MDIQGTRVLILGGSGLVGMAVARDVLRLKPATLVISALTRSEAEEGVEALRPLAGDAILCAEWGNLFVPAALKDEGRDTLLDDPRARTAVLDDLFGSLGEDAVARSALGDLILRHRPDVVVDCINTATGFAYQNVFKSVNQLREAAREGVVDLERVEKHLMTLYIPHLIHHVWLALHAMREVGTRSYVKVGTAGSGGMGLNIPFTHSEDRPSRTLLAKSAVAGAHTLLLYLMARTPGAPAVKEIKPTAAISWKRIGYGEVMRGRRPIPRVDAVRPVEVGAAFDGGGADGAEAWRMAGGTLEGVYLDAGENGLFSPGEFEALTALGLMEFITPEEIARDVLREIQGRPTGHDVVGALDAATSGPTYRAGVLRHSALEHMEALEERSGARSVAYEMLGPPRLAKLLFEGEILRRLADGSLDRAAALEPEALAERADALVREDDDLRTRMLSIGLPVLLPCGGRVLRGREVKVPPGEGGWEAACDAGWVDLRPSGWRRWRERIRHVLAEIDGHPGAEGGSGWDLEPWHRERRIRPGALAAWIFRYEDEGERIKR
jgi:NAD(P)-dependent dehydrogenase (short-subunit alcohol dehydrogenase family)